MKATIFRKDIFPLLLIGVLAFIYFSFFVNRGLTLYDEGYIVESSYLIYSGKLPYRDFFFQYTPLTAYLGAIWFKLFGTGILKLRWLALLFSVATVILGYLISRRFANESTSLLVAATLVAWGFPHANFLWPSSVSLFLLFLILYFLIKFSESQKSLYLFLSVITVGLSLLTKQNLGLANFVGASAFVVFLWLKNKKKFNFWRFYLGMFLILLASVLFINELRELFLRSFTVLKGETMLYPYTLISKLEPGFKGLAKWAGKTFVYIYPLCIYLMSAILAIRFKVSNSLWYVLFFLTSLHFFTVVWPTADLVHLSFALPVVPLMIVAYSRQNNSFWKKFVWGSLIIFLAIGFYKTLFMRYYSFETPYRLQQIPVEIRGERIYVDQKHAVIVNDLIKAKNELFKDEPVFVHSYAPMIYFILDKYPPVDELYTVDWLLNTEDQREVVATIKDQELEWVLLESWREKDSQSLITKFITDDFRKVEEIWDFEVFRKI